MMTVCSAVYSLQLRVFLLVPVFSDLCSLYHFTAKSRLKSNKEFKISSQLAQNTLHCHKTNRLMMLRLKMAVDCDNQQKHKRALGR